MGKNRKLKYGVDQVQTCSIVETVNLNQEIPQDFLTSDDFCIVQKKRGCKKISENQTSNLSRFLSNSRKSLSDEEAGNCHSTFWSHKINETSNSLSEATTNGLCSQYSSDESDFISQNTEDVHASIVQLKNDSGELNSESLDIDNELSFDQVKSNSIDCSVTKNVVLERKSSCDESLVNESNACCSKKKTKKKKKRNNPVYDEVEELLKKLNLSEKYVDNKKDYAKITSSSLSKIKKVVEMKLNGKNSEEIGKNVSSIGKNDNLTKKSLKRKEKKLKIKQKIDEDFHLEDSSSNETMSKDISSAHDNLSKDSITVTNKEENISKPKNCHEIGSKKRLGKKQLALIQQALKKTKEEEERLRKEEEAKQKIAEEVERIRLERLKLEQERKEKKKLKEKQRREKLKAEGRLLSKSQKQSRARMEATLAALRQQGINVPQISDKRPLSSHGPRLGNCKNFHRKRVDSCQSIQSTDSAVVLPDRQKSESFSSQESSGKDSLSDLPRRFDSLEDLIVTIESDKGNFSCSEESDGLEDNTACNKLKKKVNEKFDCIKNCKSEMSLHSKDQLMFDHKENSVKYRSPVVCVLGHVDTGKTKLLDYIRKTHVQDSEAGGITQQIGATMIPRDALKEKCKMVKSFSSFDMKIPGLLVIDTPGHESFSNLRSRGSSICDIAVLVVDIMHGLEPQTIESINLLKKGKTPFVVALNKVDRIYGWKSSKDKDIENIIQMQTTSTQMEFKKRCQEIILQFANQCLNATLFYENKDPRSYVSMVPVSAITGDGMGNLLSIVANLTQSLMHKKLIYCDKLEATVLEVKAIPGLGTTIDVILVNGRLQEGDTIVLAGQEGPIVTQIRSLLMPHPLKELRVKNPYIEYKVIEGTQGVKIAGKDLDKSIAGLPLLVSTNHGMIDNLKEEINHLFRDTINSIKTSERGVYVQASTLGSLEALLEFLSTSGIPYFNVKIGPVVKKDVMKASIMLEHDIMYAAILAFDVKIERDAQELADNLGVRIFHADIIYHLFDMYIKHRDDLISKREDEIKRLAVFPCKLKILPEFIFNPRDPIVLGVYVEQGTLKEGTPLCVSSNNILEIGSVSSIEMNSNKVNCAKQGDTICIKIDPKPGESPKTYGKHFSHEDLLVSRISRQSIDVCKEHFRNELQSSDWHLVVELKKMLHIM